MSTTGNDTVSPGMADYLPALASRIRTGVPNLPLEPVVLESLLMCLASGNKNLILRTEEEHVGFVAKSVTLLLATVFGLATHKSKIKSKHLPTAFLEHLFLPGTGTHCSPGSRPSTSKTHSRARPSSGQSGRHKSSSYRRNSPVHTREPISLSSVHAGHEHQPSASSDDALLVPSLGSSRQPLQPQHALASPVKLSHSADDGRTMVSTASASSVPQAVVVSGLEHAGVPAQRTLMQVLDNRLIELDEDAYEAEGVPHGECGVWPLPPNFIMVYVCPINATERPKVLSGLLDNFAMCSIVHPQHALTLPRTRSRTDSPSVFASSSSKSLQHLLAPGVEPIIPPSELQYLRFLAAVPSPHPPAPWSPPSASDVHPRVHIHTHFSLSLYATELLSQARHHPELDGTLVSPRAHADAATLLRARRVIHGDSTGAELVREAVEEVNTVLAEAAAGSGEGGDMLEGSTVHGDWLHVTSTPGKGKAHAPASVDNAAPPSVYTGSEVDGALEEDEVWEVSDKDVRKVVPKVLLHRLRVRKGPEDMVLGSVLYPAVSGPGQGSMCTEDWPRRTVEEILMDILEDRDVIY